jgi:hypothetical protein
MKKSSLGELVLSTRISKSYSRLRETLSVEETRIS